MTHSHDNTLLSRLGFADPDRKSSIHDSACQYIAQPAVAENIRVHLFGEPEQRGKCKSSRWHEDYTERGCDEAQEQDNAVDCYSELEHHIVKGEGKYSTTIGFIDVVLGFGRQRLFSGIRKPEPVRSSAPPYYRDGHPWEPYRRGERYDVRAVIEVKAHRATAGDAMRQIALYRQFATLGTERRICNAEGRLVDVAPVERVVWVLATCYPIQKREAEVLAGADIRHIQLSPERVLAWASERDGEAYAAVEV